MTTPEIVLSGRVIDGGLRRLLQSAIPPTSHDADDLQARTASVDEMSTDGCRTKVAPREQLIDDDDGHRARDVAIVEYAALYEL